jgi:simple sugar transport system ATP-binding protein
MAAGIGMVHQHFMLIPVFTVAENVMLGHEGDPPHRLPRPSSRRDVEKISTATASTCRRTALIADLPVGVSSARRDHQGAQPDAHLILDEPTAVLTPRSRRPDPASCAHCATAASIVFITHKLREVRRSPTGSVIRRGKVVGSALPTASTRARVAHGRAAVQLTVGRGRGQACRRRPGRGQRHRSRRGRRRARRRRVVPGSQRRDLCAGGVQGNGQTRSTEALVGLTYLSVRTDHDRRLRCHRLSTDAVLDLGVGYVPEDRLHDGLVGDFSVAENLVLDLYDKPPFASGPAMNLAAIEHNATERVAEFDVRTSSTSAAATTLSGGNEQKVVLARELSRPLEAADLQRVGRGARAGRPDRRHVPRPDRG